VRFLVDLNLSPQLALRLGDLGHDAVHGRDLGLGAAADEIVLEHARSESRVLISADSDFGTILAATRASSPSVLYIRRTHGRRLEQLVDVIIASLPLVTDALDEGGLVVIGEGTARIRRLPIL
jgi:predicted nuclease of predicted toxin-antitoxin system